MPRYPMRCDALIGDEKACDHRETLILSMGDYDKQKDTTKCPKCGATMTPDFSPEARAGRINSFVGFKPHYSYALGHHVSTEKQMRESAARQGIKLHLT